MANTDTTQQTQPSLLASPSNPPQQQSQQTQYLDDNGNPIVSAAPSASPIYLDDNGNPIASPSPAPVYLDDNGNPIPAGASFGPQPEQDNSSVTKGIYDGFIKPTLHSLNPATYLPGPDGKVPIVQDVKDTAHQSAQSFRQAMSDADTVKSNPTLSTADKAAAYGRDVYYALPVLGPALRHIDDLAAQGNHREAYGEGIGLLLQLLAPEITKRVGGYGADLADSVANKVGVSPRVSRMMNEYIGLQPSDLAKFKRTIPTEPEQIGSTVYKEAGFKNNLADQKAAIDQAVHNRVAEQEGRIGAVQGQNIDTTHLLLDKALELQDELDNTHGVDPSRHAVVDKLMDAQNSQYGGSVSPREALDIRRNIKPTTFDPGTENIEQRYRQLVYHALNDEIQNALPAEEAQRFKDTNAIIHRLITASDAAGEKLVRGNMKYESPVRTAAKVISPSKLVEKIPNDRILPREAQVRSSLESGLKGAGDATRQLAGNSGLNRFIQAADIVSATRDQANQ